MKTAKLTANFDYVEGKVAHRMTSYPSGYDGEMPDAHYAAAVAAGVVEGVEPQLDETTDAAKLKSAYNKDQLLKLAVDEQVAGVSDANTKDELAEAIVANRASK